MDSPTPFSDRPEPDFMPRIRRLFAEGLPERLARMQRGLEGVSSAVAQGRPPSADDLEELFLPAHSLKGTAPGVGAVDLGHEAGRLSQWVRDWRPEAPPSAADVARARDLLASVEEAGEAARIRILAEGPGGPAAPPDS